MMILNKARRVHSDQAIMRRDRLHWVPAHRLDFETSGCLLVCDPNRFDIYSALFRSGSPQGEAKAQKIYLAGTADPSPLPYEELNVEGFVVSRYRRSQKVSFLNTWDPDINKKWHSKRAVQHRVRRLSSSERSEVPAELLGEAHQVELITGARHQIRAYFASLGCPLMGDPIYGKENAEGLSLHAWKLNFEDPITREKITCVASQLPKRD